MSIITYSLLVGLILFLAFVMEQRTNRLRRDFEGLYNLRGRDIKARIALNDKFNSEMAELRDYIVGHFDEGSEFFALQMQVADLAKSEGIMSEISALWSEAAAMRNTLDMQDRLRGGKISPNMATAKTLQSLFEKDIAFLTEGYYDEAAKLSRAEQSIEILETRMGRVESDAKWRYSDFDVDGRMRLLSPYEIVVSMQGEITKLANRLTNIEADGPLDLPVPTDWEDVAKESVASDDDYGDAVRLVPQDLPVPNEAPENWTEQRITKLEQAVKTKASALQLIEQKDKLQALRIGILGGADESGLPIPGALSELRQQVEGINSNLGKKVENATKLNKAAIQLVSQSAARAEVRTILRKRKGFWAGTWGNFWRWLISPVK